MSFNSSHKSDLPNTSINEAHNKIACHIIEYDTQYGAKYKSCHYRIGEDHISWESKMTFGNTIAMDLCYKIDVSISFYLIT